MTMTPDEMAWVGRIEARVGQLERALRRIENIQEPTGDSKTESSDEDLARDIQQATRDGRL